MGNWEWGIGNGGLGIGPRWELGKQGICPRWEFARAGNGKWGMGNWELTNN
ncbi:MAG: hypothetical protein JGK17_13510 [Microcoleus sp. PH2017_10_PVI_O_A]|uniref:hypothetical protein n=1 Tax=unclassified Microcoleus TaxID=2642155 RepID=UPI001D9C3DC3|nr:MULTISPECIES: hypothetical protein [unclassified Microcoleus]MCC3406580.1 hypothetical protein [Microcoleus sp. PH2017_10_PVI_O_A]MCC3460594.1 hypothetical protein [Microcoleus sp. PH2017_11_PCY_U_A]MCC3479084.1 hypothetical protein [Microcoleus sp. PH2017_12_PCY_D_A]MCC3528909.1 hypothetical protein [Microcoleus sp. PH2017_21_RUC_O_A]MCC3541094.1 hypothetical protein [Microcoleus sp. PH2017_22_RUC_O_B]